MKFSTLVRAGVFSLATTGIYPQALSNNDGGFLSKAHATPRDNAVHPMGPVTGNQMDQMETVVPGTVLFHHTNVSAPGLVNMTTPTTPTDGNRTAHGNETDTGTGTGTGIIITGGTGNGTMATWPYKADNITACTAPTYENTSPLRTKIIRDDCEALLPKVLAQAGFWELYQWTGLPGNGNYTGLLAQGTCQFAVSRIFDEKLVHDQGQRQGGGIYTNASSAMSGGGVVNATNVAMYVLTLFFSFPILPLPIFFPPLFPLSLSPLSVTGINHINLLINPPFPPRAPDLLRLN